METDTPWKKPPFDLTPLSLMLFAQFGAVLSIAVWFIPDDLSELNAATVILLLGLIGIGLLQLFRVKNGRLLTYPCIALLALSWVVLGEFEVADAVFVTVFMSIIFTFLVYIPALAFDNYGMTLNDRVEGLPVGVDRASRCFLVWCRCRHRGHGRRV